MTAKNVRTVPNSDGAGDNGTNQSNTEQKPSATNSECEETKERLALIFNRLDRNANGRIDIQELIDALKGTGVPQQYAEVSIYLQC